MKRYLLALPLALFLFAAVPTSAKAPSPSWTFYPVTKPVIIPTKEPRTPYSHSVILKAGPPVVKQSVKSLTTVQKPQSATIIKGTGSAASAKKFALERVGARQFRCLDNLWTRESHWNYKAGNPSSGAYGIPQALPGSKMKSAGADWRTNPITQVKWGLKYINARYGSACNAWRFWQSHHWY